MSLYMQAYTTLPPFSQDQFPPLISRLSLCGLTGRSSPVNLSYPLFRLCLPPASHIFSTWQSLNLSADGAHYYFLWLVRRGRGRGEWRRLFSFLCALWRSNVAGQGADLDGTITKPATVTECKIMINKPAVWFKIDRLNTAFKITWICCILGLDNKPTSSNIFLTLKYCHDIKLN